MVFPQEFLQCLWNRVEPGSSGIRPELSGDSSPLSLRLKAAGERRHRAKTAGKAPQAARLREHLDRRGEHSAVL